MLTPRPHERQMSSHARPLEERKVNRFARCRDSSRPMYSLRLDPIYMEIPIIMLSLPIPLSQGGDKRFDQLVLQCSLSLTDVLSTRALLF